MPADSPTLPAPPPPVLETSTEAAADYVDPVPNAGAYVLACYAIVGAAMLALVVRGYQRRARALSRLRQYQP